MIARSSDYLAHVDHDAKVRENEEDSCHAVYQVHKDAQNDFELDRQDLFGKCKVAAYMV